MPNSLPSLKSLTTPESGVNEEKKISSMTIEVEHVPNLDGYKVLITKINDLPLGQFDTKTVTQPVKFIATAKTIGQALKQIVDEMLRKNI